MAWTMKLTHKELVGSIPNRSVRLLIEVTDGVNTFTLDMSTPDADNITLAGIRRYVQTMIEREADLLAKNNQLNASLNVPIAVYV